VGCVRGGMGYERKKVREDPFPNVERGGAQAPQQKNTKKRRANRWGGDRGVKTGQGGNIGKPPGTKPISLSLKKKKKAKAIKLKNVKGASRGKGGSGEPVLLSTGKRLGLTTGLGGRWLIHLRESKVPSFLGGVKKGGGSHKTKSL